MRTITGTIYLMFSLKLRQPLKSLGLQALSLLSIKLRYYSNNVSPVSPLYLEFNLSKNYMASRSIILRWPGVFLPFHLLHSKFPVPERGEGSCPLLHLLGHIGLQRHVTRSELGVLRTARVCSSAPCVSFSRSLTADTGVVAVKQIPP